MKLPAILMILGGIILLAPMSALQIPTVIPDNEVLVGVESKINKMLKDHPKREQFASYFEMFGERVKADSVVLDDMSDVVTVMHNAIHLSFAGMEKVDGLAAALEDYFDGQFPQDGELTPEIRDKVDKACTRLAEVIRHG